MGWQQLLEEKNNPQNWQGSWPQVVQCTQQCRRTSVPQEPKKKDGYTLQLGLDVIPGTSTPASLLHHGPKGNSDCTQEAQHGTSTLIDSQG